MEEGTRQDEGRVRNNLFLSFCGKVNQISCCCVNSRPTPLFLPAPLFLLIKRLLQTKLPLTLSWEAGESRPSCLTCPCRPHLHSFDFLWLPQRFSPSCSISDARNRRLAPFLFRSLFRRILREKNDFVVVVVVVVPFCTWLSACLYFCQSKEHRGQP